DSVDVNVSYSAVEDQEIVVWFQLDQQPFTTFQEFRQTAQLGQNDITVKLFIPPSVPVAQDAYQYQTLLVPTGGGWPERISNIAQTDIDVVMVSNIDENGLDVLPLQVYPNPTKGEFTVQIPSSSQEANLVIYSALGEVVQQQIVPSGIEQVTLDLNDDTPAGVYWLHVRRDASYSTVKLLKQ
ncbi:MAG: T9SS type A sorting domain-containing protein, partial [Bacteroidota bacterium]